MTDKKTIDVYNAQVDSYAKLINDLPEDKILLDFISRLKPNAYVLDLGCGPAVSSATMREHSIKVDPVDASEEMIKLANKTFNIDARVALFEDIDSDDAYDGIWANFSLLHAARENFPSILKALHRSLKPQGLFHLGMKLGSGAKRDNIDRFYTYYSEKELKKILRATDFRILHIEYGEDLGLAGNVESWIAITSSVIKNA